MCASQGAGLGVRGVRKPSARIRRLRATASFRSRHGACSGCTRHAAAGAWCSGAERGPLRPPPPPTGLVLIELRALCKPCAILQPGPAHARPFLSRPSSDRSRLAPPVGSCASLYRRTGRTGCQRPPAPPAAPPALAPNPRQSWGAPPPPAPGNNTGTGLQPGAGDPRCRGTRQIDQPSTPPPWTPHGTGTPSVGL